MADPVERARGLDLATATVRRGELVVLPTDTVYGAGADAFSTEAVARLRESKGRPGGTPVPVLIGAPATLDGIAADVGADARELVAAFWPGPLTLLCRAQPSLRWDVGATGGTVAVRMPLHPVAIELLTRTGPMAVGTAARGDLPAAATCEQALAQLGDSVRVYLDGGPSLRGRPSTVVDATGEVLRLVREGVLDLDRVRAVVPRVEAPV